MTLYIIRREGYTNYCYGGVIVHEYDSGEFFTCYWPTERTSDVDGTNRRYWEENEQ